MDIKTARFIELIDNAIAIVNKRLANRLAGGFDPLSANQLNVLLSALQDDRQKVLTGTLESSYEGRVTLGLTRGILDWNEPSGTPLINALVEIEDYYARYW